MLATRLFLTSKYGSFGSDGVPEPQDETPCEDRNVVCNDEEEQHVTRMRVTMPPPPGRVIDKRTWRQRRLSISRSMRESVGGAAPFPHRLIRRNLPFHQSANKFNVSNSYGPKYGRQLNVLLARDWFHVLLEWPTIKSIGVLVIIWNASILFFALLYAADDNIFSSKCNLAGPSEGPSPFATYFALSLETCTTVGYGLPGGGNAFFENCPSVIVTIYFQMLFSMLFNAFLMSVFFLRLGRCDARGGQVLFADRAVVSSEGAGGGGAHSTAPTTLEFRLYDASSYSPLVEAHVRLYAMRHGEGRGGTGKMAQLRVDVPDDDMGAVLHTSIPFVVKHTVDSYSPLLPPRCRRTDIIDDNGLLLREADSHVGSRDGYVCPLCGDSYGTRDRLLAHVRYNQVTERHDGVPVDGSHQSLGDFSLRPDPEEAVTHNALREFWEDSKMEIIAVVEAIDPINSGTFQAVQSYTVSDVAFGAHFEPCTKDGVVDLDKFHKLVVEEEGR